MKRIATQIVLAGALIGPAAIASGQTFKPVCFEMRAYVKTDNQKRSEVSRIWFAALNKFRMEQEAGAQKVTTIVNGQDVWELRPLQNAALHAKENPETIAKVAKQTYSMVDALGFFKKKGGKRVGRAKIEGVLCDVYRRKDPSGMIYTMWAQPDGRVKRMTSSGTLRGAITLGAPIETHSVEQRTDIKWLPAAKMDESLFRPPAGLQITERAPGK